MAAKKALENFKGSKPDLALCFSTLDYHLDDVRSGVKEIIGSDVTMVGASSTMPFNQENAEKSTVVVSLISSDTHLFYVSSTNEIKLDTKDKVGELVNKFPQDIPEDHEYRSLMIFVGGLAGNSQDVVNYLDLWFGKDVAFTGGLASDQLKMEETFVMHNDEVLSEGLVCVLIASKKKVSIGVRYGHLPLSDEMTITKSKDNVVYEIDGKPAWDAYRESIREPVKIKDGFDIFDMQDLQEITNFLCVHEFGLKLDDGNFNIRAPVLVNKEDGSMVFIQPMFEGTKFRVMYATKDWTEKSANLAIDEAIKKFPQDSKVSGAMVFDCSARGIIMQDDYSKIVGNLKNTLGEDVPLVGVETYGEIVKDYGDEFVIIYNTTIVVLLLPD